MYIVHSTWRSSLAPVLLSTSISSDCARKSLKTGDNLSGCASSGVPFVAIKYKAYKNNMRYEVMSIMWDGYLGTLQNLSKNPLVLITTTWKLLKSPLLPVNYSFHKFITLVQFKELVPSGYNLKYERRISLPNSMRGGALKNEPQSSMDCNTLHSLSTGN